MRKWPQNHYINIIEHKRLHTRKWQSSL